MKKQKILRATIAALIVWVLGLSAFVSTYLFWTTANPETQANWALVLALIPATALGARFYYKKNYRTKGLKLGTYMFGIAILLDACITVPLFIIPEGGNHLAFFREPVFWLIGLEYISLIALYAQIWRKLGLTEVAP